jgi:hypothetical protein
MLRSWENRVDTVVLDEPLYAAALAATGADHPMRDEILAAGPVDPGEAVAACLARPPLPATISYQKHMAHHLLPTFDRGWLDQADHVLLIRHPRLVIASYTRVWPEVTVEAIGLPQQIELAERAVLIVDSSEFLTAPRHYLELMCSRLGVPFDPAMLAWPAGRRASDGVWAPAWYGAVEASTGFGPPPSASAVDEVVVPPELEAVVARAEDLYRELHAERLVVGED